MLQPKRVKYRKMHRGHRSGKATTGNTVDFGEFFGGGYEINPLVA